MARTRSTGTGSGSRQQGGDPDRRGGSGVSGAWAMGGDGTAAAGLVSSGGDGGEEEEGEEGEVEEEEEEAEEAVAWHSLEATPLIDTETGKKVGALLAPGPLVIVKMMAGACYCMRLVSEVNCVSISHGIVMLLRLHSNSHNSHCIVAVPTPSSQMLLLVQTNVSARVDHEVRMTLMNEAQMGMLEQVGTKCGAG